MRHLPAIASGRGRWVLPMADRSARFLAEFLLAEDRTAQTGLLADALAADPPWLLWTLVSAAGKGWEPSWTLSGVAHWLAGNILKALQGASEADGPSSSAESDSVDFSDLVFESLEVGHLAAALVSKESTAARDSAWLGGLLHNAPAWFVRSAVAGVKAMPEAFSRWLASRPGEVAGSIARAVAIVAGEQHAPELEGEVAAAREFAGRAAQAWAATTSGWSVPLPVLASRMGRLDQLERRFRETLEREKLDAMAELAAGAGHEINNPLAIIAGRAQLFLQDETDPERRREAAIIVAQVKRAHEMIADLRLFARPPQPEPETTDLAPLLDGVLADLAPQAAERGSVVVRAGHSGPVSAVVDPAQIRVAVHALVRNALEATGHGGRIEVELRADDACAEIRVADNGPGIAEEDRRHIFEPFFSARQAGRGLGMGLSKCWRIVTAHGGRIEVDHRPGGGAVFVVRLPRRGGEQ